MIRKLLCWLGWHDWVEYVKTKPTKGIFVLITYKEMRCKHCGKVKR